MRKEIILSINKLIITLQDTLKQMVVFQFELVNKTI